MLVVFGDAMGPLHSKEMEQIPRRGDYVYLPDGRKCVIREVTWWLDSDDPHVNIEVERT